MERLLATSAEKQRSEDELRDRLLHPDPRRAFCDFIAASVKDIDESLWDSYSQEAFSVLTDFKRRSRALSLPPPPVPQARLQGTRPAGTSTPTFQQQPQSGVFQHYQQQSGHIYTPTPTPIPQQHQQQIQHLQQVQLQPQPRQQGNIGKPSPPKYVPAHTAQQVTGAPLPATMNNPSPVPGGSGATNHSQAGGSGTAAHNASSGSIGMLVRDYNEADVPISLAQMNTPTYLEEEDKDDQ